MTPLSAPDAADPQIVAAWIHGWTLARETASPTQIPGGWHVHVGWPGQRERYVFPQISAQLLQVAETVVNTEILLKVCASPEAVRAVLPSRWHIRQLGFLMTLQHLSEPRASGLPDGMRLECTDAKVGTARVLNEAGEVLAVAHLSTVGEFAIYDRVETHEAHRRRGLARAVVGALSSFARVRGARRGVLVATAEGQALYRSLGWELHSLYTTASI